MLSPAAEPRRVLVARLAASLDGVRGVHGLGEALESHGFEVDALSSGPPAEGSALGELGFARSVSASAVAVSSWGVSRWTFRRGRLRHTVFSGASGNDGTAQLEKDLADRVDATAADGPLSVLLLIDCPERSLAGLARRGKGAGAAVIAVYHEPTLRDAAQLADVDVLAAAGGPLADYLYDVLGVPCRVVPAVVAGDGSEHHRGDGVADLVGLVQEVLTPRLKPADDTADPRENRPAMTGDAAADAGGGLPGLRRAHPWPVVRPPLSPAAWRFTARPDDAVRRLLAEALSPSTRVVLELGGWLGESTRWIADRGPTAHVITIGGWQHSDEPTDSSGPDFLPVVFDSFLALSWEYRYRITPVRASVRPGLGLVAGHGVEPDLIVCDAEHGPDAVTEGLEAALELFPRAAVLGGGWRRPAVAAAVTSVARRHGRTVRLEGNSGWALTRASGCRGVHPLPARRSGWVVLVPYLERIEAECDDALRHLERGGVRVVRRGGGSAIDLVRNELLSDALHDGATAALFIDSDLGFAPRDALALLARPEPVVSGVYSKKGSRQMASQFADGIKDIVFGPTAPGPYPLKYAATGFLRVRSEVLTRMIADLELPLCNTAWGRGIWPFFQPTVIPLPDGSYWYLAEDYAFSHRLGRIGVTPLADTSIRLWHWGRYPYGWEDAGRDVERFGTRYGYKVT